MITLGVLSEQGGSLRNLRESGQDRRFVEQYLARYADVFDRVYYFSYDNERAQLPDKCELIPNRLNMHRWAYAFLMPLLNARRFRQCNVIRVMQLTGEVPALVAKFAFRVPFAATYGYRYAENARSDGLPRFRSALFALRTRLVLKVADRIIVTNPSIRQEVLERVPQGRVEFLPNGVDLHAFRPSEPRPVGDPAVLLYVGRLSHHKNLRLILDAASRLRPPVVVRFIGDGPIRDELCEHAASLRVHLELPGTVDHLSLPGELRRADVFVFASRSEGHPKALLEAMSCGCVCVATNAPGVTELLEQERTGLLCDAEAGALCDALMRALTDTALRATLSTNARAKAERDFDIDAILRREVDMLKQLAAERPC